MAGIFVRQESLCAKVVRLGSIVIGETHMNHDYNVGKLRATFVDTYQKMKSSLPLSDLEQQIAYVIGLYPEYHSHLSNYQHTERIYQDPQSNPFLKMSLHIAILEQVSTNRPQGVLDLYQKASLQQPAEQVEKRMAVVLYDHMQEALLQGHPPDESEYLKSLTQALCEERS